MIGARQRLYFNDRDRTTVIDIGYTVMTGAGRQLIFNNRDRTTVSGRMTVKLKYNDVIFNQITLLYY